MWQRTAQTEWKSPDGKQKISLKCRDFGGKGKYEVWHESYTFGKKPICEVAYSSPEEKEKKELEAIERAEDWMKKNGGE